MPEVSASQSFTLRLTDREFRLLAKGLALVAGLKVSIEPEERGEAADLNKALLTVRRNVLREQLQFAEKALEKAEGDQP